jgi:hypothetical protein
MSYPKFLPFPLLLVAASLATAQESPFHARVSFEAGGLLVQGSEETEWAHATLNTIVLPGDTLWVEEAQTAEIELYGGSFFALADGSKAEVSALSPAPSLKAWVGSFYVHRLTRSSSEFVLETPACVVQVPPGSQARVDVEESGFTIVAAQLGSVTVNTAAGAPVTVSPGHEVFVDVGMLPSEMVARAVPEDEFDQWARERHAHLSGATLPETSPVPATVIGAHSLARYGEWVTLDNRSYWRPTVVRDYVPYRYGHWSSTPHGYLWVERYPFSYVTTHYGRWDYHSRHGWLWRYDRQWRPAYAVTLRVGDHMVWSPLGWDNRPVIVNPRQVVNIGGVTFGTYATSYVPVRHLLDGYGYIQPYRRGALPASSMTNIQVWNFNSGTQNYHNLPYLRNFDRARIDTPRRARGPLALAAGRATAPSIVQGLEQRLTRGDFRDRPLGSLQQATRIERRGDRGRQVRMSPEARDVRGLPAPETRARGRAATPRAAAPAPGRGQVRSAPAPETRGQGRAAPPRSAAPAPGRPQALPTPVPETRGRGRAAPAPGRGQVRSAPAPETRGRGAQPPTRAQRATPSAPRAAAPT